MCAKPGKIDPKKNIANCTNTLLIRSWNQHIDTRFEAAQKDQSMVQPDDTHEGSTGFIQTARRLLWAQGWE